MAGLCTSRFRFYILAPRLMSMAVTSRGFVWYLTGAMIRRINLMKLLSHSVHFHEKCRVLSSAMSTSYASQNKYLRNSKNDVREKVTIGNKTKYEDTFGNIEGFEQMFERTKDDPEDILEYQREKAALGKTIRQYINEVKSHLDKHDYKSALHVLEVDMVNDKKRLTPFIYKVLINYNAKIGNLKEAYRLFINFKKRHGFVTGAMYTAMFNACANCRNSLLAIEKANAVQECMRNNKRHSINISNYNVMLKAYGRHGDMGSCLKIMDEILERRDRVKSDTYSFLLQACISDKNSGLRHGLIVWRKMIQNRVRPNIYLFNLLLKCVNDCSLGDTLLIPSIIDDIKKESDKFFRRKVVIKTVDGEKKRTVLKIPASGEGMITPVVDTTSPEKTKGEVLELVTSESSRLALEGKREALENREEISQIGSDNSESQLTYLDPSKNENVECGPVENLPPAELNSEVPEDCKNVPDMSSLSESELPNLIACEPSTGSVVAFGVMTQPHHRFVLLGGMKGFLRTMTEFGVQPNVKTFTLMLNVIPPTNEAEQELMSVAMDHKVKLDTTFFNMLIRRRCLRDEESSVKDCLEKMFSMNLKPDLITFGVLAMGCRTYELGMDLLKTLRDQGYRANSVILETLLKKAAFARDMKYVKAILEAAKEDGTDLSQRFVAQLSKVVDRERYLRKIDAEMQIKEEEEGEEAASARRQET